MHVCNHHLCNIMFPSLDRVELCEINKKPKIYTLLYIENKKCMVMDQETYDQVRFCLRKYFMDISSSSDVQYFVSKQINHPMRVDSIP